MEFNATINNISVILWWSVLLVKETGAPGENQSLIQNLIDAKIMNEVYLK